MRGFGIWAFTSGKWACRELTCAHRTASCDRQSGCMTPCTGSISPWTHIWSPTECNDPHVIYHMKCDVTGGGVHPRLAYRKFSSTSQAARGSKSIQVLLIFPCLVARIHFLGQILRCTTKWRGDGGDCHGHSCPMCIPKYRVLVEYSPVPSRLFFGFTDVEFDSKEFQEQVRVIQDSKKCMMISIVNILKCAASGWGAHWIECLLAQTNIKLMFPVHLLQSYRKQVINIPFIFPRKILVVQVQVLNRDRYQYDNILQQNTCEGVSSLDSNECPHHNTIQACHSKVGSHIYHCVWHT